MFGGVRVRDLRYCRKACQQKAEEAESRIRQAKRVYETHLAQLRQNPRSPKLRKVTLEAGRVYAATTRYKEGGRITLFDETAIENELEAASAAAAAPSTPTGNGSLSIEQRLEHLASLRNKNLISNDEYQVKRAAILAEL